MRLRRARVTTVLSALVLSGALVACGTDDVADVQGEDVAPGTAEEGAPGEPATDGDTPGPEEDVPLPEQS